MRYKSRRGMRKGFELLKEDRRSRAFFLTLMQSSLGTGASYVALVLLAFERYESPLAISLVLGADLLPAMLLGPVFGAIADRWSRRWCAVAADVLRVVAFIGIAVVDDFAATVAFATLAGIGTGLFVPSALAGLATVAGRERLPAATALFGAASDFGYTVGPALAAGVLAFASAETLMLGNGITFAVSAVVLWRLSWGQRPDAVEHGPVGSLLNDAREGIRVVASLRGTRTVLFAGGALLFFGGLLNVAELILAKEELGVGETGFSMLVAVFGAGFFGGSLSGSRGGALPLVKRRFLVGGLTWGVGTIGAGVAPNLGLAMVAFAITGFGNGAALVYERLAVQSTVADSLLGRVFGFRDALTAWAFALAFTSAGVLISVLGSRVMLVAAGIGELVVVGIAVIALRGTWEPERRSLGELPRRKALELDVDAGPAGERTGRKHAPDLVSGRARWLTMLDDLDEAGNNHGVELGPGVDRELQ